FLFTVRPTPDISTFPTRRSSDLDEEFIRTKDLIGKFSLAGVSRTNAVFDRPKLEWFNTQYLQKLPIEELLPEVENELMRSGLWKDRKSTRLNSSHLVISYAVFCL